MKIVYLDELFLLNLVIDYFLLLATARICALPFRRGRFALAAVLGGLWCCLALLPAMGFLRAPLLDPVLSMLMVLIAFGAEKRLWRCFFAFLGVSALFGGAVYAAALYRGVASRGPLFRLDMRVLVLSFALCWALVRLVFRRSAKNAERVLHDVILTRNGARVALRALADTGNDLHDPLSGRAVLVAEAAALAPLFPGGEAAWLTASPVDAMVHIPGMRLIPWADIGGENRLLLAFRPDRTEVDGTRRDDLLAAVAPAALGGDGSFQAIL